MNNSVAVVTGAAKGIGFGIAERFIAGGYTVIAVDMDGQALEAVAHKQFVPLQGDVSDRELHDRAAELAADHGRLETWVNNAGVALPVSIHALADSADNLATVERTWGINQGGTFWGTAAAIKAMLASETRGAIVNISSTQALRGFAKQPAYAASKGAIISMSRQVAAEYAPHGIRCNAIAPGVIETPLNKRFLDESGDPDGMRRQWLELCPIGRWGTPADVAEAAWFLGTDASSFVTGQVLAVDGGQTAIPPASL